MTCGNTKTQFIKGCVTGGSFPNSEINKLPFKLHLPGHNFTGPGTILDKRLNTNGTPKEWSNQINRVDNAFDSILYGFTIFTIYSQHDET